VVSAGVCGALAPTLAPGDLVVPAAVVGPDGRRRETAALPALPAAGVLLTVTEVVGTPAAKARLWMETGALACDMESAAVLDWAHARGVPGTVVRGVADAADRALPADLAGLVDAGGRVRAMAAVRVALARPRAIAEAMTLRTGVDAALRSVAAALAKIARTQS
jgi:adenosylhomocysteine nucleosidase